MYSGVGEFLKFTALTTKDFCMIKMVIMDMAGTTINDENLVYKCMKKALNLHKCKIDLPTVHRLGGGKAMRQAIVDVYSERKGEKPTSSFVETIYDDFRSILEEAYADFDLRLFDGVSEVLRYLKEHGIIAVLNTGFSHSVASKILKKVDCIPGTEFDLLVTADMVKDGRPAPDMIYYAIGYFDISREHIIKIGDTAMDIMEGKNAQVKLTIGITSGVHKRAQLEAAAPDLIIDEIRDLIKIIEAENG